MMRLYTEATVVKRFLRSFPVLRSQAPRLPYLEFLVANSSEVSGLSLELAPESASLARPMPVTLYPRDRWMMQSAAEVEPGIMLLKPSDAAPFSIISKGFGGSQLFKACAKSVTA